MQNAAQVLLIWQIVIVESGDQNFAADGIGCCKKPRLAAPITDTQVRLALGFLREMEPDMQEINAFQLRYNAFFQPEEGVHWLH
ncbi:protein yicN [Salmonella bongori]|nr:protein yicN [Salmonella bongori]